MHISDSEKGCGLCAYEVSMKQEGTFCLSVSGGVSFMIVRPNEEDVACFSVSPDEGVWPLCLSVKVNRACPLSHCRIKWMQW